MATYRGNRQAFGSPGLSPRWTHGDKEGVGTAYAAGSRLWFTVWNSIVTEVYYPSVDAPQMRDLQYLITDGESFFHDEIRNVRSTVTRLDRILGYRVHSEDPEGRYSFDKEIISDGHLPCLLQHTRFSGDASQLDRLKVYVLCAPHLGGGGAGNSGFVVEVSGRQVLVACKDDTWMALATTHPFSRLSVGFVGASDGWTDLSQGYRMDWEFDEARNGNIALTGEIPLAETREFTVAISFGRHLSRALTTLFQVLGESWDRQMAKYYEQWERANQNRVPLEGCSFDGGLLFHTSHQLLLAHEDKTYQGAIIASMSIPWGEAKSDEDGLAGYHLVWVRDLVQSATALLAAGHRRTALRSLIYLAINQLPDGSFPQNFWIDGRPYWTGVQLDEVAFPILLAHRLWRENALDRFDPYPMVLRAAGFLVRRGPITQQERWEENSGFSPSTLAATIAALFCAANMMHHHGDIATATFLEEHADFIECNIENWTVTNNGSLVPGICCHYVRINPARIGDPQPYGGVGDKPVLIANRPPGEQYEFPANQIVDAGFLELVRYGVRAPDNRIIVDSLRVVDALLRVETDSGVAWRRYNNDGYGQQADGAAFTSYGRGGAWPLLSGERGHYELAAGRDAAPYIRWLEGFATSTGMLPEQIWDGEDIPERFLRRGRPTGAAIPLMWAHAEYLKLLRSMRDGRVFDFIPEVAARYLGSRFHCRDLQVWSFLCPAMVVRAGDTLRVIADPAFLLHWSIDDWSSTRDTTASTNALGIHYADIAVPFEAIAPVRFTFYWSAAERWEGRDYEVRVIPATG